MNIDSTAITHFQQFIWQFYKQNKRSFAWRNSEDSYCVVVSEIMLQQTQTYRVEAKYEQFITEFPTFACLAQAPLRDVLAAWQGLGYNRRGKALHAIARKVCDDYNGRLPQETSLLEEFPGIGPATASSICAFAFNMPTIFIETNIRTVFIHSFFNGQALVHDKEIMPLVAATVDPKNPREWYYALMDYGVHLKKMLPNPSRRSVHHTKQTRFEGSDRQVRGLILKFLTQQKSMTYQQLIQVTNKEPERLAKILEQLCAELFIIQRNDAFEII